MIKRAVYRPGMVLGPRDLYVGRGRLRCNLHSSEPGEWGWLGNPYDEGIFGLDACIEMYAKAFISKMQADPEFAARIRSLDVDRVLCWCQLDKNCHGDFIVAYLEELKNVQ
jgi:hypothetical protein